MANLKNTNVTDLTISGFLNVQGNISSFPIGISGYKDNGGGDNTSSGPINWNGIWANRGMQVSNSTSRFTVPETGYYVISQKNIGNNNSELSRVYVDINGSNSNSIRSYARGQSHNYPMSHSFAIFDLTVGDYIEFRKDSGNLYLAGNKDYTQFAIYKIG